MPLGAWLKELQLDSYVAVACRYVEDCGMSSLSEVRLHIDAFGEAMALKPAEKARLVNGAQNMQTELHKVQRSVELARCESSACYAFLPPPSSAYMEIHRIYRNP